VDAPIAPAAPAATTPQPPLWSRAQLEVLAGGSIAEVFGPQFAELDQYERLVRMPQPPLLFADRVMSIEGEPGSMGTGRIVTETDVTADQWYMHVGRMSPGVVIESGQADLLLASWLGADFSNRGERVYRLLGCDLTFTGELPRGGETLHYDIHIDGHAKTGDTRLFFFHYDCYIGDRLMISVRNGQAGFFSAQELSQSDGVLWDAADDVPREGARRDAPPRVTQKRSLNRAELDAFTADVKKRGGAAVADYTAKFDGLQIDPSTLESDNVNLHELAATCPACRSASLPSPMTGRRTTPSAP
jgi:3-hydroxymyristoyl/3-hydroxydecanoyl-(acyl carrier protein) dehydratase